VTDRTDAPPATQAGSGEGTSRPIISALLTDGQTLANFVVHGGIASLRAPIG
jgi:hypothetical protein